MNNQKLLLNNDRCLAAGNDKRYCDKLINHVAQLALAQDIGTTNLSKKTSLLNNDNSLYDTQHY